MPALFVIRPATANNYFDEGSGFFFPAMSRYTSSPEIDPTKFMEDSSLSFIAKGFLQRFTSRDASGHLPDFVEFQALLDHEQRTVSKALFELLVAGYIEIKQGGK